jgi:hypothetical protein
MIIKLGRSVGNNLDNTDDDVRQVKKAFSRLRMFDFSAEPEPHGYMTRPFRDSILKFQKENNLTVDGKMFPGGETEKYINKRLMSDKGSPVPKVEKGEILPPPKPKNIPGTNIPDRSQPEQGFPPPRQLKMEKWRLDMDKGIWIRA